MTLPNFQTLTNNELARYVSEVKHAHAQHNKWVAGINRCLVCRIEPEPADIDAHSHELCSLGRWYKGIDHPELWEVAEFSAIREVHQQIHALAKRILGSHSQGQVICEKEYDAFLEQNRNLDHLIGKLIDNLKHNIKLIARLMGQVYETATDGVMITDKNGMFLNVNHAFTEVTGYNHLEVIGKSPEILSSGKHNHEFFARMWESLVNFGQWRGEIWNRRKTGEVYPEWLSITAIKGDQGETSHYVGIFSDISAEKENDSLYHLAHYDILTELPNRLLFYDRLNHALAIARRNSGEVAVMFLDLDGFKTVNDTHGHTAGDNLLQKVAKRLVEALRETDTVARMGGDEFTIILPEIVNREDVSGISQKLVDKFITPFIINGAEVQVTTSIGVSYFPSFAMDGDILVSQADTAMYEAKRSGKNCYRTYDPAMD